MATYTPQSWNLYTYVGNSPLVFTDPSGLWKQRDCTGGATRCFEAEKGDTLDSLGKLLGVPASALVQHFGGDNVAIGQVFDVSGIFIRRQIIVPPMVYAMDPIELLDWRMERWSPERWSQYLTDADRELRDNNQDFLREALGQNSGAIVMTFTPIPAVPIVNALKRLGFAISPGRGAAVVEIESAIVGGNPALNAGKMFKELRGNNPVTQVKPGVYTAKSATGNGTVTLRTPAGSRSGLHTVDTPHYSGGVNEIKFK
jgi:hypothetical protein